MRYMNREDYNRNTLWPFNKHSFIFWSNWWQSKESFGTIPSSLLSTSQWLSQMHCLHSNPLLLLRKMYNWHYSTSLNKNFLQLDQQNINLPLCRVNRNLIESYLTPVFFSFLLFPTLSSLVSRRVLGTISGKGLYRISAFIILCGYSGLSSCKMKWQTSKYQVHFTPKKSHHRSPLTSLSEF